MRKDEFIVAATSYNKAAFVLLLIPMLLAIVCLAMYAPYHNRFEQYLESKFGGPTSAILAVVPPALPMLVALCFVVPASRRIEKKLGLTCPHCAKNVAQLRTIVITSKNCPYCGMKVLDEKP
jgi:DNA-directed RNA polymerase subunit RPC12/RpoP